MKVTIRSDKVTIEGYVNAVERFSKPLADNRGSFIERILAGCFARALKRNENVFVLLNHWPNHVVAQTGQEDGNNRATLREDNIGLFAHVETDDARVMEKARAGLLRGWSFGFNTPVQEFEKGKDGMEERTISDLNLVEVSILDDEKIPAYYGTSIETRGDDGEQVPVVTEFRAVVETQPEYVTIRNEEDGASSDGDGKEQAGSEDGKDDKTDESASATEKPDYSEYEERINKSKEGI